MTRMTHLRHWAAKLAAMRNAAFPILRSTGRVGSALSNELRSALATRLSENYTSVVDSPDRKKLDAPDCVFPKILQVCDRELREGKFLLTETNPPHCCNFYLVVRTALR
jgi:hypothetical protein